ncbi:MAG: class I SAM-dependent methyltransferase [Acidimicrobiales bacterium]
MEAGRRWRRLVRARAAETRRLTAEVVPTSPGFWDQSARRMADRMPLATADDPFLRRLRRACGTATTVVDVGAGSGRYALALAPHVRRVVAVDSSPAMLDVLADRSAAAGVGNVDLVVSRWEDAEVPVADVVFSAFVLPLVEDAAAFLRRLDAGPRRRAFLYLGAPGSEAVYEPFWRYFHGVPRRPGPTWLDALAVLREIGVEPDVEVLDMPFRPRFASLEEAVDDFRRMLALPDTAAARSELSALLDLWLVRRGPHLASPAGSLTTALLSWRPASTAARVGP